MSTLATTLLGLALSLLMSVQNDPAVTEAKKQQAISVANYAIQVATEALSSLGQGASGAAANPAPVVPPPAGEPPAPPAATSTLPVAATSTPPSLTVAANSSLGILTPTPGYQNQAIASFIISAGNSEDVDIATTTIKLGAHGGDSFTNVRLTVGGMSWGTTVATTTNNANLSFASRYPFRVPAGNNVRLDVLANVSTTAYGMNPAATLTGCSGMGTKSGLAVSCNSAAGPKMTAGAASITPLTNSAVESNPVYLSRANQRIASFVLAASRAEDINVSSVSITMGNGSGLSNLKVMAGSAQFGTSQNFSLGGGSTFIFYSSLSVPAGTNSAEINVYADVTAAAGMYPAAYLSDCRATGAVSGQSISCSGSAAGQNMNITE